MDVDRACTPHAYVTYPYAVAAKRKLPFRRQRLLDRLEHRLAATPDVLAFCAGAEGLRGTPPWDHTSGPAPDAIAIDRTGVVWLIDVCPPRSRVQRVASWCRAQSTTGDWHFRYLPLDRAAMAGGGAIAFP